MVETPVEGVAGYSKLVIDAVNFSPAVELSWGGDEKSLCIFFLSFIRRESILLMFLLQRLRGRRSSKIWNAPLILRLETRGLPQRSASVGGVFLGLGMYFPSPLRCSRRLGSLGLLMGFCPF